MSDMNYDKRIPEIRFAGYTDAWERRKLGELGNLLTGFPFESKQFVPDGIRLLRGANVKRGTTDFSPELSVFWETTKGLEQYILKENDIVIQMDGALVGKSYARLKTTDLPALLVQRVTRFRADSVTAKYAYQCISSGAFDDIVQMQQTNTAVPHISLNDIKNFSIPWPINNIERERIAAFFGNLDDSVTLHQRKLEMLKNLKKALLEKMFV